MNSRNATLGTVISAAMMLTVGASAVLADEKPEKPKAAQPKVVQKKIQIRGGQVRLFSALGGRGMNVVNLINNKQVQGELKIADDQLTKLREITQEFRQEMRSAFQDAKGLEQKERQEQIAEKRTKATSESRTKILAAMNEDQAKRLKQIELQQRGAAALQDSEIAKSLELTDKQRSQIKAAFDEQSKKDLEIHQQGLKQANFPRRLLAKTVELRKETEAKVLGTLTESQKKQFEEMKGEKFEFRRLRIRAKAVPIRREA